LVARLELSAWRGLYLWLTGERRPQRATMARANALARSWSLPEPFPGVVLDAREGAPRHHGGRSPELPGQWGALARAVGSVGELAAAVGVTRRAVQYWARGEATPNAGARDALARLAKARGVRWR
jgi:hypothetical protein